MEWWAWIQSSKKLPNKSKKASIQVPLLPLPQGSVEWALSGTSGSWKGEPVVADLVYDLASVSKVVGVATICAFLYAKGELALDRPFKELYPRFAHEKTTIRELLTILLGWILLSQPGSIGCETVESSSWKFAVKRRQEFSLHWRQFSSVGLLVRRQVSPALGSFIWRADFYTLEDERRHGLDRSKGGANGPWRLLLEVSMIQSEYWAVMREVLDFSTVPDLERFLEHYLKDDFARDLSQNFAREEGKTHSWMESRGDWLDHTGYTGTFIMYNRKSQRL